MKKVTLMTFPRFWNVAEVWENNIKIADINRFYKVTDQWILIFETSGGQGTGYKPGNLMKKIFIGDCEFEVVKNDT